MKYDSCAAPDPYLGSLRCAAAASCATDTKKTLYLDGAIWALQSQRSQPWHQRPPTRKLRDQWIAAQKEIDAILADWPIAGGGDGIRRRIGTVGTTSPLFDIEKTCPETVWKSRHGAAH